jgi:peptidyl-prolyl cis-trans isomerase C
LYTEFRTIISTRLLFLLASLISVSCLMAATVFASGIGDGATGNPDELQYVAMVNGKKITMEEFQRNVDMVKSGYAEMGFFLEGPQLQEFKKKILNSLIEKELLLQESENKGIVIDPAVIEKEIDEIKSSFPDETGFEEKLREMGYTIDFVRNDIRIGMAIEKLVEQELAEKTEVSSTEIKSFYDSNIENFKTPEQVKARHILVNHESGAKKKIENIKAEIAEGSDFAMLAEKHSACPSGQNGGDLGYFSRGQMVEAFEEAAFGLQAGEVSDIVETRFGFHIIKVEDRRPEETKSFEEVKAGIEQKIRRQNAAAKMPQFIETLKEKYPVEIYQADLQ